MDMNTTSAKEIVLGITGSIAAYKSCEIASLLVKKGVRVRPVFTASATEFVGPATLEVTVDRSSSNVSEKTGSGVSLVLKSPCS